MKKVREHLTDLISTLGGYLKAQIKTDVILNNVISTAGEKENNVISVKIEGDLP